VRNRIILLSAVCLFSFAPALSGQLAARPATPQAAAAPADTRLDSLPPALRDKGRALLKASDEKERARLAEDLARTDAAGAREFLLSVLESDSSARVRSAIINRLGRHSHPQIRQALERRAAADADARVALLALERLRAQQTQELRRLLDERLAMARRSGDRAAERLLAQEHERWVSLVRGTMLPAFLRVPPPLFALKAAVEPVRVLAFGDFGNGTENQKQVAAAMMRYHRQTPFDFAVTLGDNFYSEGMESPADARWKTWWDELYDPLGIKFYATLGNHDWGLADSPAAEILYSEKSPSWRMPAPYYTFTAGPVQFFALDTNEISEAQVLWLTEQLDQSRARWKLVYGHHPIYSAGAHEDSQRLINQLLPVLKGRADVFLAGHDHDLQHLKPEGALHFFIAGGGGANVRPVKPHPRTLFAKNSYGFAVIEADAERLKVRFVDPNLSELYHYTITKTEPPATANPTR
jgi:tartrate-resistant acid phosphatase type 5